MSRLPDDKKKIIIATTCENNRVLLKITDTGEGILPENLDRIFNHGFTTKENGQGFGLHASANAMIEMDGTLAVESEGRGCGATFILKFPRCTARNVPVRSGGR